MYLLYNTLTVAGMFVLAPYFLIKAIRHKKYLHTLRYRLAMCFPPGLAAARRAPETGLQGASSTIWVHAVSVGEALAAVPLSRALKARYPERRLVISTTTATGQAVARERMKFADAIFYFPLDWPAPVRRALGAVQPGLAIIFETEIWPNFLREARRAGVPVVFVNGRISDRSFHRFSSALRLSAGVLRGFLREVLGDATLYLMQSEQDRTRLVLLGASPERVKVVGNMKYDLEPRGASDLVRWLAAEMTRSRRAPLLIAGSVIAGEEAPVLEAFASVRQKWPGTLLVMAPRKPERFDEARSLIGQAGGRVVNRSDLSLGDHATSCTGVLADASGASFSVLLLDTIGELSALYQLADAVFIGGSLEPAGGHNPLEPAAFGKVPVFGPSMDNFREMAKEFLRADAALEVRSGAALGDTWIALLTDTERREHMGRAAKELVDRHRGATAATLGYVEKLLEAAPAHP